MADELSKAAREALDGELVLVVKRGEEDGVLYTHEEFLGAFQAALLDRIEHMVTPGASSRQAARALAAMRTPQAHQATLVDALGRLRRNGHPVDPVGLVEGRHRVVAVFPA